MSTVFNIFIISTLILHFCSILADELAPIIPTTPEKSVTVIDVSPKSTSIEVGGSANLSCEFRTIKGPEIKPSSHINWYCFKPQHNPHVIECDIALKEDNVDIGHYSMKKISEKHCTVRWLNITTNFTCKCLVGNDDDHDKCVIEVLQPVVEEQENVTTEIYASNIQRKREPADGTDYLGLIICLVVISVISVLIAIITLVLQKKTFKRLNDNSREPCLGNQEANNRKPQLTEENLNRVVNPPLARSNSNDSLDDKYVEPRSEKDFKTEYKKNCEVAKQRISSSQHHKESVAVESSRPTDRKYSQTGNSNGDDHKVQENQINSPTTENDIYVNSAENNIEIVKQTTENNETTCKRNSGQFLPNIEQHQDRPITRRPRSDIFLTQEYRDLSSMKDPPTYIVEIHLKDDHGNMETYVQKAPSRQPSKKYVRDQCAQQLLLTDTEQQSDNVQPNSSSCLLGENIYKTEKIMQIPTLYSPNQFELTSVALQCSSFGKTYGNTDSVDRGDKIMHNNNCHCLWCGYIAAMKNY